MLFESSEPKLLKPKWRNKGFWSFEYLKFLQKIDLVKKSTKEALLKFKHPTKKIRFDVFQFFS